MSASGSLPYPSLGAEWPSTGAWPSPSPEARIVVPGVRCDDTCRFSNDNSCDDGGVGSAYSQCPRRGSTRPAGCVSARRAPSPAWERAVAAAATARGSKEPEERPPPRAPGGATLGVATDVAVESLRPRRSSSLKDAPEFTAALAAWRHSFSETPTVGVADASGAPTDDVFRV